MELRSCEILKFRQVRSRNYRQNSDFHDFPPSGILLLDTQLILVAPVFRIAKKISSTDIDWSIVSGILRSSGSLIVRLWGRSQGSVGGEALHSLQCRDKRNQTATRLGIGNERKANR